MSVRSATSAAEVAARAPFAARASTGGRERLKTCTSKPPTSSRSLIGHPILPRPTNPTFRAMPCSLALHPERLGRVGEVALSDPDDHPEATLAGGAVGGADVDAGVGELAQDFRGGASAVRSLHEKRLLARGERQAGVLGRPGERLGVLRHDVDLRLSLAGGKSGEGEQVHPRLLERAEHAHALARLVRNFDVVIVHAADLVCHGSLPGLTDGARRSYATTAAA